MRRAAQRHDIGHGDGPGNLAHLRQEGRGPGAGGRGQGGEIRPPLGGQKAKGCTQERGFARTIGTDQADELFLAAGQGDVVQHQAILAAQGQVFQRKQCHASTPRIRHKRCRKKGAPTKAVSTPSFRS